MAKKAYRCRFVISVLIADRVGVLRDITAAVTELDANIEGISQTVVHGYFTVVVIAAFRTALTETGVRDAILAKFRGDEASVTVRPYDPNARQVVAGDRYILTMSGRDRPGILKKVTAFLAEKGINVEDLFFLIRGEYVTHIGEVTVPRRLDVRQIQGELQALLAPMKLTGMLQHENIFRVTNEVGSVQPMLKV